jgi:hypothetical protein
MPKARSKQAQPNAGDNLPPELPPAAPAARASSPDLALPNDQPGDLAPVPLIDAQDFEVGFGERLDRALDLDTWNDGRDLSGIFERLDEEVSQALLQEDALREQVRKVLFPIIAAPRSNAPKGAGVFRATRKQLEATQRNVLFNGGVEACDGTCAVHDTLPLTITQIGVCLVSYLGEQGAWGHRLYRKDLRMRGQDSLGEALEGLQRRDLRAGIDQESQRDQLSELGRRGIMSYAERAVLLWKSEAPWRMGHGQPAPYELLTGSGSMELLERSLNLLRELILEYRRFVFVPSAPGERLLLTIGHALRPLEFAIVETSVRRMDQILKKGHLRGEHRDRADAFTKEAGPEILIGVYRTYTESPPQVFYAHADFVQDAALVAMADSLLQPQRAFPTLIDLADNVCSSLFGTEGFNSTIQTAYAKHGHPLRYLGERETRR